MVNINFGMIFNNKDIYNNNKSISKVIKTFILTIQKLKFCVRKSMLKNITYPRKLFIFGRETLR